MKYKPIKPKKFGKPPKKKEVVKLFRYIKKRISRIKPSKLHKGPTTDLERKIILLNKLGYRFNFNIDKKQLELYYNEKHIA